MRLIDADALKDDFCAMKFPTDRMNVLELIDNQPTITAEQKHGRWEDCSNGWMCSECTVDSEKDYDFCPNCGARMDAEIEVQ